MVDVEHFQFKRRHCSVVHQSEPHLTARELQKSAGGEAANVSVDTVKRELRRSGLIFYPPCTKTKTRLMWARQHSNWSEQAWRSVVFSDVLGLNGPGILRITAASYTEILKDHVLELKNRFDYPVFS